MFDVYFSAFLGAFGGFFFAEWLKSYLYRKYGKFVYTVKIIKVDEI
jgi:hypothetical protein